MKAYVINLDTRADRWDSVVKQWENRTETLIRVSAVESNSISESHSQYLPPQVVANWKSQCKVFSEFLSTKDSCALILEDDFILGDTDLNRCLEIMKNSELDFLQLGYLYNSPMDFIWIKAMNFRDALLKFLSFFAFKLNSSLCARLLLQEQKQINFGIVLNHAGAGSHAYMVSRKFAEEMLVINKPVFLAADGLFIAISNLRFLKMGRLRSNRIKQSNSPSSITKRFVN
ncbi:glycosyltransferase family 25 protein [Candidatus Planktophila versatilis]|uniref:glycosyltransferase family 25 protein n=1 Tax=Candidatus Planktophila versatilis TaxID=1884905 RepID=UPI000BACE211|nr:glycosyltransferase family 25 protein [Candidatus Planktophila versatilis]ASY25878.1 glycosyltransferase [Candidatus Planktophila versatilis]